MLRPEGAPDSVVASSRVRGWQGKVTGLDRFGNEVHGRIAHEHLGAAGMIAARCVDSVAALGTASRAVWRQDRRNSTIPRSSVLPALAMAAILGDDAPRDVFAVDQPCATVQGRVRVVGDCPTERIGAWGNNNFCHGNRVAQAIPDVGKPCVSQVPENPANVLIGLSCGEIEIVGSPMHRP